MAEAAMRSSGNLRQPSRLQRRAPASIQISPATDWKAAIPLLSPLITSPTSDDLAAEIQSCGNSNNNNKNHHNEAEKPTAFKKWQHPAAPFSYEPAPFVPLFCTGGAVKRK
ncbi:uncharacterized protein At4g14450, chloroplastic-like [Rhododendron vialii]|uniref:uncharacterized protein At4g14450, chloroplastic-like n=1 Tax=Rhododendron vialii TaxID=182163 RepID=UPI00265EDFDD|nr:uncharacterized protein At4g14450, chloroplastic-like [Rhododendron vialii]